MTDKWISDMSAVLVGLVTIGGVALAVQWLYYWPKVLRVVKEAVGEAMKVEHEFVQREVSRVDTRHDSCIFDTKKRIDTVDSGLREDIKYIRGRLDWLVEHIIDNRGGNHG